MAAPINAHAKNEPLISLMRPRGPLFALGPAYASRTIFNQTLYIRVCPDCHHKIFQEIKGERHWLALLDENLNDNSRQREIDNTCPATSFVTHDPHK